MFVGFFSLLAVFGAGAASRCDYVVDFASAASGPDGKSLAQVRSYLQANDALVEFGERSYGKEGERAFCVRVKNHGDLAAVRSHLERIVDRGSTTQDPPRGTVLFCGTPKGKPAPSAACTAKYR